MQVEKEMDRIQKGGGILKQIKDGSFGFEKSDPHHGSEKKPLECKTDTKKRLIKLKEVKSERDNKLVNQSLREINRVASVGGNLMGPIITAVQEYATVGEICNVLKESYGENDPSF